MSPLPHVDVRMADSEGDEPICFVCGYMIPDIHAFRIPAVHQVTLQTRLRPPGWQERNRAFAKFIHDHLELPASGPAQTVIGAVFCIKASP